MTAVENKSLGTKLAERTNGNIFACCEKIALDFSWPLLVFSSCSLLLFRCL